VLVNPPTAFVPPVLAAPPVALEFPGPDELPLVVAPPDDCKEFCVVVLLEQPTATSAAVATRNGLLVLNEVNGKHFRRRLNITSLPSVKSKANSIRPSFVKKGSKFCGELGEYNWVVFMFSDVLSQIRLLPNPVEHGDQFHVFAPH